MKRFYKWLPYLIVAVGLIAYANSIQGSFVFDDSVIITNNRTIDHILPISLRNRCLVNLSFKLNYAVGEFKTAGYHIANFVIHIINGLLLFAVIRSTLLLPYFRNKYINVAQWIAFISSIIWVVHPIQTASVTYVCQRYESMMGLFYLAGMYCFIRSSFSQRPLLWHGLTLGLFFLGLGAKETILTLPVVLLLYDYIFLDACFLKRLKKHWWVPVIIVALMSPLIFSFSHMIKQVISTGLASSPFTPLSYFLVQLEVVTHYLKLVILPYPLSIDYAWIPATSLIQTVYYVSLISLLGFLTIWTLLRRHAAGFLGAWFFLILAPTSSFIPLMNVAFEHRMYLPLAAVIVLLVMTGYYLMEYLLKRFSATPRSCIVYRTLVPVLIVLAFLPLTIMRNMDYRSEEIMLRKLVSTQPHNPGAYLGLGLAIAKKGRVKEAEPCFHKALNRLDKVKESLGHKREITIRAKALNALGVTRQIQGVYDVSEQYFRDAIKAVPNYVEARNNLGIVLRSQKRLEEAIQEWKDVFNFAQADGLTDYGLTHYCLAMAFLSQGHISDGIKHLESATEWRKYELKAGLDLAWILAVSEDDNIRDGNKALDLAFELQQKNSGYIRAHDVLSAAYAEVGQFDKAVKEAEQAYAFLDMLSVQKGNPPEIEKVKKGLFERIELFKGRKPYRISFKK